VQLWSADCVAVRLGAGTARLGEIAVLGNAWTAKNVMSMVLEGQTMAGVCGIGLQFRPSLFSSLL